MNDAQIREHIDALIAEEHRLLEHDESRKLTHEDRRRLDEITVLLDQYWDLLRQRRARRGAGQDPDAAHMRKKDVVEHYQQ